ncbi:MAG TPA: MATE family efflux transporter [Thermoanaerobaculia bacterium]|nr:MATE family efflux transporter [Thermoanaerobaculia bacterium]
MLERLHRDTTRRRRTWFPRSAALREARALAALTAPLTMASLASMGISITDVVMMGWLGPAHLAAGAVTSDAYSIVFYLAAGVLAAVAPMVAHARGAGRTGEVGAIVHQGLWAAALLALPGAALVWSSPRLLAILGVADDVVVLAAPYARWMAVAFVAMTGVALMRQTLAAVGRPRVFFLVTLATLPLNALGNWALMFEHGRFAGLGLAGAGASSALASTFMLTTLLATARCGRGLRPLGLLRGRFAPDPTRLREMFAIGLPIGVASLGETGVFLFSTLLAGVLGTEALAAHAVALRCAGVLYALPLGLSQAATVRVGLGAGAGRPHRVLRTANAAFATMALCGAATLLAVALLRRPIAELFLGSSAAVGEAAPVLTAATILLLVLAVQSPIDALATVSAGCLRGLKDTRVPMVLSLLGYWGLGFGPALLLAFVAGLGVLGLWLGLATGSIAVSAALLLRWRSATHGLRGSSAAAVVRVVPATARRSSAAA